MVRVRFEDREAAINFVENALLNGGAELHYLEKFLMKHPLHGNEYRTLAPENLMIKDAIGNTFSAAQAGKPVVGERDQKRVHWGY